jgi:hypothetical protein
MVYSSDFEDYTREVVPYALCTPVSVDVCVANILIEQLCRASMVAAIVSNMVPVTVVSFGHSTDEVDSLKAAYADHMEWLDDQYAELSARLRGSVSRTLTVVDGRVWWVGKQKVRVGIVISRA